MNKTYTNGFGKFYYVNQNAITTNVEFEEERKKLQKCIHTLLLIKSSESTDLFNQYLEGYFEKVGEYYVGNGLKIHEKNVIEITPDKYCMILEQRRKFFTVKNIRKIKKIEEISKRDEEKIAKSHMLMLKKGIKYTK